MVFIESQAFTSRLHQLAGASSDEVLRRIHEDLLRNPEKGDVAFLLDKDEQVDLTTEQRRNLRLMAAELKSL